VSGRVAADDTLLKPDGSSADCLAARVVSAA